MKHLPQSEPMAQQKQQQLMQRLLHWQVRVTVQAKPTAPPLRRSPMRALVPQRGRQLLSARRHELASRQRRPQPPHLGL